MEKVGSMLNKMNNTSNDIDMVSLLRNIDIHQLLSGRDQGVKDTSWMSKDNLMVLMVAGGIAIFIVFGCCYIFVRMQR